MDVWYLIEKQLCKKWNHKRCSGVCGDLSRVADGFRCRRCDGTIQEVDLAGDLMVDGELRTGGVNYHASLQKLLYMLLLLVGIPQRCSSHTLDVELLLSGIHS